MQPGAVTPCSCQHGIIGTTGPQTALRCLKEFFRLPSRMGVAGLNVVAVEFDSRVSPVDDEFDACTLFKLPINPGDGASSVQAAILLDTVPGRIDFGHLAVGDLDELIRQPLGSDPIGMILSKQLAVG